MTTLLKTGNGRMGGCAFVGWACAVLAACGAGLPSEWRNCQPLQIERPGLVKISLPLETLTASRPGLEDLRLFDPEGREVPYLIERPVPPTREGRTPKSFQVMLRGEATVVLIETGITQALSGITLRTPATDFIKAARVEVSVDQRNWEHVAEGQPVFKQPNGASQLGIVLPARPLAFVRLTLDDRRSNPVPITGAELRIEAGAPPQTEPMAVQIVQRSEEPGQTRLTLRLAGANVTLADLTVETAEPLFTRAVTLSHVAYTDNELREAVLARGAIFRVAVEGHPSAQNLTAASNVEIPTPDLSLTIQNDDNPVLPITGVKARRYPVHLLFNAGTAGQFQLLTGNSQCDAPRYELAGLGARLRPIPLSQVVSGPITTNASYRAVDPLAAIQPAGAPLDVAAWRYRRPIVISEGSGQQLELDLAVLAHSSPGLHDLRLMRDGRQVPFILERLPSLRSFAPPVRKAVDEKRRNFSRWKIVLPHPRLPIGKLTTTTAAPYFQRDARLVEERRDDRGSAYTATLGTARWSRTMGSKALPLVILVSSPPTTETLLLELEDGDNPPLELQEFEVWHATARLLFKPPERDPLFLYYGNPEVGPPQYDLQLLLPKLRAAAKGSAQLGPEESLKTGAGGQSLAGQAGWIFWTILAGVVAGLLVIIARLLPKPAAPTP